MDRGNGSRRRRLSTRIAALSCGIAAASSCCPPPHRRSQWEIGDVFANTPDGPTAVQGLRQQRKLQGGVRVAAPPGEGTGCAIDANHDLYGTFFQLNQTLKFSHVHPTRVMQTISNPGTNESIVFDSAGNFYIGIADPTAA